MQLLDANTYLVQRYNDMEGPTHKYKETELYLFPSMIFLSDPLNTMNVHFINNPHALIPSPLNKHIEI